MAILTDIDLEKHINYKDLAILPCNSDSITGLGYDLAIGILVPMSHHDSFIEDDENYIIPSNCYCLIITKEFVWLSENLAGTLHARGTLAARGLYILSTNVDPNFQGQMIMSVKNISGKSVNIKKNECFITMILHRTCTPTRQLVGSEGSKKSMRVITYLLEEVYTEEKTKLDINCRKNINKLSGYYTESSTRYNDQFINIIHDCKSPFKRSIKYITNFRQKQNVFGWGKNIISIIAWCLLIYLMYDYFQLLIADKQFTVDQSRAALIAFSALVVLLSSLTSKK
jgi:deoxycytidine triphosphate deaminase